MREEWKDVVGYEGRYKVSNTGKVYSLVRRKELAAWSHSGGYLCVSLVINLKKKNIYVHRIVAQAFIPNLYNFPQINHKDENKRNNKIDNLEWCTNLYNHTYGTVLRRRVESTDFAARGIKMSVILSGGAVCQYDLDGNFINRYTSANKASRSIDGKRNYGVNKCLQGKVSSAYGYVWTYEDKFRKLSERGTR